MAVQTAYTDYHSGVGFPGQVADQSTATIISRTVEQNPVAFGAVAIQGDADLTIAPSADATDATAYVGIVVRDQSTALTSTGAIDTIDVAAAANVMTQGAIWVNASLAVAAGDPVYFTAAGVFTNVSTGNTVIPNARWETSTAGAAPAIVRLA